MILAAITLFGRKTHALKGFSPDAIGGVFFCGPSLTCVVPAHRPAFKADHPDSCVNCARAVRAAANQALRRTSR